ncbi:hypothetical protein GE21DRAFT_5783 [Neurospora crassa]|uniref:Uncharacterized protein n=1 Tax=Neurospora crassa (strain ATCC 24698 / 74-OR23-1A / CBS 708.71 / DSM 1257 / FGSC 987) TaxID=367110 RepID=Q7SA67_NEUCR|nr:hypothetical protein NCU08321 [Neurospora crassa OR74A]EAA33298.1 hypothetical protein NCU08321 [Neurospora crassa OR74A]KHE82725.1 hypothetical protein GE21DRAFT_5783 [Neurospora crassa]|eukprot:XP_962534.1 hypothetical protein NCU08321 [Neurospora crassa OR74A]
MPLLPPSLAVAILALFLEAQPFSMAPHVKIAPDLPGRQEAMAVLGRDETNRGLPKRSGTWQAAAQKGQLTYDHVEPDGVLAPNPSLNPASLRP